MQALFNVRTQTLSHLIWPERYLRWLRFVVLAVLGAGALIVSSKISFPLAPTPFTLQTLTVLLLGFAYGPSLAAATVGLYLFQGDLLQDAYGFTLVSAPQHLGAGFNYMITPSSGYLIGFLVAAVFCGILAKKGWDKRFGSMALAMVLAYVIIYSFGLTWLGSQHGWNQELVEYGFKPFIAGDMLQIAIAVAVVPMIWKRVNRL